MSNKNEVFEYLIDQLRQQITNSQCEDLSHKVLSLKNQLHDASARIKELREDNIKKSRHISHLTAQVKELHMALVKAPAVCINCGVAKSSECEHDWYFYDKGASLMCKKCGLKK